MMFNFVEIDKKREMLKREMREARRTAQQQQPKVSILERMTSKYTEGPLSLLRICMKERKRYALKIVPYE